TSPSFPDGTPILIKPEGFDLISGKFYIAKHRDGETTFKQYIYDAGREYLVPLNAKFETVEMDDAWDVIGRVIDQKAPKGVL
ncbi:MAG: S24 family peptidase, partial [Pseudomonas aeruginosa]|nr:S24 family peptidase [Pseudomonas aeruginosa]